MLNFNKIPHQLKPPYSAQEIALFLLSLDPHRKYFFNRKLNSFFTPKIPNFTMGNFRLNAHLQIAQMLYYAHYQQPLFTDKIEAYEHGGYVKVVYHNFPLLLHEKKTKFNLDQQIQEFLNNLFYYLKTNYTNRDLEYFVCEDIAWGKAWAKKTKNTFTYDEEVMSDYQVLINPLWKDMVGTRAN